MGTRAGEEVQVKTAFLGFGWPCPEARPRSGLARLPEPPRRVHHGLRWGRQGADRQRFPGRCCLLSATEEDDEPDLVQGHFSPRAVARLERLVPPCIQNVLA
eukprot:3575971-Alexandrium_andersonii.AAC.1